MIQPSGSWRLAPRRSAWKISLNASMMREDGTDSGIRTSWVSHAIFPRKASEESAIGRASCEAGTGVGGQSLARDGKPTHGPAGIFDELLKFPPATLGIGHTNPWSPLADPRR